MKDQQLIHIGTSGWHYAHWKGPLYPPDVPAARFLQYYSERFHTVEVNNSFYRLSLSWKDFPLILDMHLNFVIPAGYVRLHGPNDAYRGCYNSQTLAGWADAFSSWIRQGKNVYCYFDNDDSGYAPQDALRLQSMVKE